MNRLKEGIVEVGGVVLNAETTLKDMENVGIDQGVQRFHGNQFLEVLFNEPVEEDGVQFQVSIRISQADEWKVVLLDPKMHSTFRDIVDESRAKQEVCEEWLKRREHFDPEHDIANDFLEQYITRAEVNYDSLTGSFSIPDRNDLNGDDHGFSFFLNEDGVIFIDDDRYVAGIIDTIAKNRKWHDPCIERFLY